MWIEPSESGTLHPRVSLRTPRFAVDGILAPLFSRHLDTKIDTSAERFDAKLERLNTQLSTTTRALDVKSTGQPKASAGIVVRMYFDDHAPPRGAAL